MPPIKLTWREIDQLAWALRDRFPTQDPLRLSFPKLHQMIVQLDGFADDPQGSNEAVLERIQMAWYHDLT